MPKFAANLTMLYHDVDFLDRFEAAAACGFNGVEYLFPYAYTVADITERLQRFGLTQVLHNLPAGDWGGGDRGIACDPDRIGEFRDGVGLAIEYATALGCNQLNCLAGIVPPVANASRARDTLLENLQFAASTLEASDIRLLAEPVNTRDIPGFFLNTTGQAIELFDEIDSDNLYLQYDIYHMQIMEGDLARTIATNLQRIAHMQLADNPGRHEPGSGEINFPFLFDHIDELGYSGWIGCEYVPAKSTVEGLGWARSFLQTTNE